MTELPQTPPPTPAQPPASNPLPQPAAGSTEYFPNVNKPIPEELVLEWEAASRPHKKRNRQYFTTILIFVVLISLILFFAGQFLPIAVVVAVAFLVYVLEMVPPSRVHHMITTYGVRIEDTLYYWDELGLFWFTDRYGQTMLHIEIGRFPGRLTMLLGDMNKETVHSVLSEVLINQRPPKTTYEKLADRLQELIPLE